MNLLEIKGLEVAFPPWSEPFFPVRNLSFSLGPGRVLGLVGQSGSGKSMTALAVMGMLPRPGKITKGEILFNGHNLRQISTSRYRKLRGRDMFLIFQGSGSALTPSLTIGRQLAEIYVHLNRVTWRRGISMAAGVLERVRLDLRVLQAYPFELSGGMRQRVLVAMALACEPGLLIADEATTGLDMVTQAEILNIFSDLKARGRTSIILITHDLRVVGRLADEVAVMHEGRLVDHCPVGLLSRKANHHHTNELLKACRAFSLAGDYA